MVKKCIDAVVEASGKKLTRKEALKVLKSIQDDITDGVGELDYTALFNKLDAWLGAAVKNQELFHSVQPLVNRRASVLQMFKDQDHLADFEDKLEIHKGNFTKAVQSVLMGANSLEAGARRSWGSYIEAQTGAIQNKIARAFLENDISPFVEDVKFNEDSMSLLWDALTNDADVSGHGTQGKLAGVMYNAASEIRDRVNKAGGYRPSGDATVLFDARNISYSKLSKLGESNFVTLMHKIKLDEDKLKALKQHFDIEGPDSLYYRLVYKEMTTGRLNSFDESKPVDASSFIKERYQNLASKESTKALLPFSDFNSFKTYHKELGEGSLIQNVIGTLTKQARNMALMEKAGPFPEVALENLFKQINSRYGPDAELEARGNLVQVMTGDAELTATEKVKQALSSLAGKPEWILDALTGRAFTAENASLAELSADVRNLTTLAVLPGAGISQLSDLATSAALLQPFSKGPFDSFARVVESWLPQVQSKESKIRATLIGGSAEALLRGIHRSGLIINDKGADIRGRSSRWVDFLFKWNGMSWRDRMNRSAAADVVSQWLASPETQTPNGKRFMQAYGLDGVDLQQYKTSFNDTREIGRTGDFIFPELIEDVEVQRKVQEMVWDVVADAVSDPTFRTQALLNFGTDEGTTPRFFVDQMFLFKSFAVTQSARVVPRIWHGSSSVPAAQVASMMGYIGLLISLSYVRDVMRDVSQGRSPKDYSKIESNLRVLQGAGIGGILGDIFANDFDSYGSTLQDFILGPSIGRVADAAALESAAVKDFIEGDFTRQGLPKTATKNALRLLNRTLLGPVSGYPIVGGVWNRYVFDAMMDMADPEASRSKERRMRQQFGQEFLF